MYDFYWGITEYANESLSFKVIKDYEISFSNQFDIIFCNSAFQWFRNPTLTLGLLKKALRKNGQLGVQAPATTNYCPNFTKAIKDCCEKDEEIKDIFSSFKSPWFYLETANDYKKLFESVGLEVSKCYIDEVHQSYSVEKTFDVFNSGAVAGYLNQDYFSKKLPQNFSEKILNNVKESFKEQASKDGIVDLVFYRVYIIAG